MSRWIRTAPALALTVAALLATGCGGSNSSSSSSGATKTGPQLSAQAWGTRIHSIFDQLRAAAAPVRTQGHNPQTWFTLASKLKQMESEVAALRPPSRLASVNAALVSGMGPLSGEATTIGNDIKGGNSTAAKSDAVTFIKSLFGLLTKLYASLLQAKGSGTGT